MLEPRDTYTFIDGYVAWFTAHVSSVPVIHNEELLDVAVTK